LVRDVPEEVKPDVVLDCVSLYCPMPVFKTRIELDKLKVGQVLEVIADDPAAEEDIKSLTSRIGHEMLKLWKEGDQIHFLIKKVRL